MVLFLYVYYKILQKYFPVFVVRNIISDRIQCTIMKMCHAIEKKNKLNSENLKVLKSNQRQLEKAYCKGAILYLKSIEVITLI